jgi:hypothetical protein
VCPTHAVWDWAQARWDGREIKGAKFWLRVMNELKNRGVEDVLVAVVDGLKGFPDAITAVFPQATVQTPDRGPGQALHRSPAALQPRLRLL